MVGRRKGVSACVRHPLHAPLVLLVLVLRLYATPTPAIAKPGTDSDHPSFRPFRQGSSSNGNTCRGLPSRRTGTSCPVHRCGRPVSGSGAVSVLEPLPWLHFSRRVASETAGPGHGVAAGQRGQRDGRTRPEKPAKPVAGWRRNGRETQPGDGTSYHVANGAVLCWGWMLDAADQRGACYHAVTHRCSAPRSRPTATPWRHTWCGRTTATCWASSAYRGRAGPSCSSCTASSWPPPTTSPSVAAAAPCVST